MAAAGYVQERSTRFVAVTAFVLNINRFPLVYVGSYLTTLSLTINI